MCKHFVPNGTDLEVAKRTNYSEDRGLKVRFSLATIVFDDI